MARTPLIAALLCVLIGATFALALPAGAEAARKQSLSITSESTALPGLVSGGEVLLRIGVPSRYRAKKVHILRNRTDVSGSFQRQPGGTLLGLVTGLVKGANVIEAYAVTGTRVHSERAGVTSLTVTNHPLSGPVFSGPQQTPFYCQTADLGLGSSKPPECMVATKVSYVYRSTSSNGPWDPTAGAPFKTMADPSARPADLAYTTVEGRSVPFIVRFEEGTIDRGIFQIAALYDGRAPSPLHADTSWNHRLVYRFGGGCNSGYHQFGGDAEHPVTGGVFEELFLRRGYAVASNSLNVFDYNCSIPIAAEAAMMTKEHFIDTYGPVVHTIGWGGSGGGIEQYGIAEDYPGILDGIVPGVAFPNADGATGHVVADCMLLDHYFATHPGLFTAAQENAITGYATYKTCQSFETLFGPSLTATRSCDVHIPLAKRWNEETDRTGVKCNMQEALVNALGVNPSTGFAHNFLDNVGQQYGLTALEEGVITPAQFVALNNEIGGLDFAGRLVSKREVADPAALKALYSDDLDNSATLGLADTPVIDLREYDDLVGFPFDIHTADWSFVMRQRMQEAHDVANQVILENQATPNQGTASDSYALTAMNKWLDNIEADHTHRKASEKIADDKPAGLADGCFIGNSPTEVPNPQPGGLTYAGSKGPCENIYKTHANPMLASGQPLDLYGLKCALSPVKAKANGVTFTQQEVSELTVAFPKGVCDYHKRPLDEVSPVGVWLDYRAGPSARPFSDWAGWRR